MGLKDERGDDAEHISRLNSVTSLREEVDGSRGGLVYRVMFCHPFHPRSSYNLDVLPANFLKSIPYPLLP